MLDSIFTGITGVRAHQAKINVIGNNVANINTTAFKAGRVNFADVISRTLSEGGPGQGQVAATNPIQSGLGVKVSSIDSIVTQGTLQSTGVETDLAIEGDGMFIMGTGPDRFYTRDGTFGFDATGRLYDPGTGLVVQGNVANEDGTFKSELEDLIIPLDRESEAKATAKVNLSGNLDASAEGSGSKVWNANTVFGKPARLTTTTNPSFPLDLSIHTSGGLKITVNDSGRISESTINIPTKVYADQLELVAEMNALWGYPFNRSYHMFSAWRILALASTTRARLASFKPGFEPMRTAWTTSNGCGGPTASSVRVAATKAVGAWAMAASCVRRVRHAVR